MSKKRLLIAGGGYADIPLINAAKTLGYYVITTGNRAEDLGHRESDEYCCADFSDPEAMLQLAKKLKIDVICPCCNDFSVISSAYVAEQLDLPGHDSYETTKLLHHKDKYREFAFDNGIPTPKAMGFSDLDLALSNVNTYKFPIMIKPTDLTGGKGITKISSISETEQALKNAFLISKSKRVVVEEFIEGSRHGFSALLREGKIVFHFLDNEDYYLNPYMVSAASTPSIVPQSAINNLINQSEKIASLLSLVDGIFHVQFILKQDKPIIIEICRRPPGDLYIQFVSIASGIDYPAQIVKYFTGENSDVYSNKIDTGYFTRHCIMSAQSGIIKNVIISEDIKSNIYSELMWWNKGDKIDDYLTQKLGIVMLHYSNMEEMNEKSKTLNDLILVELSD